MNTNKWLAASLIAVFVFAAFAPLAQAAPGSGPGERDANAGADRPNMAHQGHHWDEENPVPTPVNPPEGGPAAPEFDAGTATDLLVTVWGDLDADGVRDPEESVLENVFIVLQTETGMSVRFEETDEMGQVCFLNLTPGEYVLDVRPPTGDFLPVEVPVEILAGENEVEIGLRPVSAGG